MRLYYPLIFIVISACMFITSCSKRPESQKSSTENKSVQEFTESGDKTRVNEYTEKEKKVINIAKKELERNGWKAEDLKVRLEYDSSKKRWLVMFDPKGYSYPGGDAMVTIEEDTGKVVFMPGE